MDIRDAQKSDLGKVSELIKDGAKEGLLLKRTKKELMSLIKAENVVVAEENNELVGIIILDFYSKRLSEMRSLYVKPEQRRNGIGSQLIKAVFAKAKQKKVKELLTITVKENTPWFKKQGFNEETHHLKVALFKKL
ncbi:MAG: GNAT family N-acetyltransferase [archaeon]